MTGRPDDHRTDRSQATDEGRTAEPDPPRSTDGAGVPWRHREPTPGHEHEQGQGQEQPPRPSERASVGVVASIARLVRTIGRLAADALILGLWVIFLTLLFLETNWPRWGFYGLLLVGVAVYVSVTAPWLGTRD